MEAPILEAPIVEPQAAEPQVGQTVALLPWGEVIDDFLDSLGVTLDTFRDEFTGSWMFNFADALRTSGVHTVLFCVSLRVTTPRRFTHRPTGATICILPAPAIYRVYRALSRGAWRSATQPGGHPFGASPAAPVGDAPRGWLGRMKDALRKVARDVRPYLATPVLTLARELRRERCGAILCQEYENPRFDVCVLLGRLLRIPVFATYQGGKWWLGPLERLVRPKALHACAGIIVGSGIEATRVQRRYGLPANKIARIFNPVDIRSGLTDRAQAREALGIPSDARVVVWHGRVEPVKGLDLLLEAWDQICREREGRDLRLLLVGTGSYSGTLHRRLVQAPPLRGVEWRDEYVHDRAVIRRYLCAADVYTLPSRHEGFPVAPIEAMSCGLPVVATDVPGVADILAGGEAGGGLIVPIGDAPALATALGRLLDDDAQAQALGRRARQRVEAAFSLEAVGVQLRRLLFPIA